jgi:hypothetical protein
MRDLGESLCVDVTSRYAWTAVEDEFLCVENEKEPANRVFAAASSYAWRIG